MLARPARAPLDERWLYEAEGIAPDAADAFAQFCARMRKRDDRERALTALNDALLAARGTVSFIAALKIFRSQ